MNDDNIAIADELEDIALQLSMLDTDNVKESLETINTELQRIEMLSQLLEVPALEQLNHWAMSNAQYSDDKQSQSKSLLDEGHYTNWIDILSATLRDYDSALVSALETSLTEPKWLSAISTPLLEGISQWLKSEEVSAENMTESEDKSEVTIHESVHESAHKPMKKIKEPVFVETEKNSYNLFDSGSVKATNLDDLLSEYEKSTNTDLDILAELSGKELNNDKQESTDIEVDIIDMIDIVDSNDADEINTIEVEVESTHTPEATEATEATKNTEQTLESSDNTNDNNNEINSFSIEVNDIIMTLSMISKRPDDVFTNTEKYISELQRLDLLAELSGYPAIAKASAWCQRNIEIFSQEKSDASRDFIATGDSWGWLELSSACLSNPDDISLLPAVSVELMRDDWAEPLEMDDLQSLILFLQNPNAKLGAELDNVIEQQGDDEPQATEPTDDSSPTLKWDDDVHPELLSVYFQETPEQVTEVAQLLQIISKGDANKEQHQHAARIAHTIKGASGVVGITALVTFTHKLEDILDYSVSHKLSAETAELLAEASDCLESLFEAVQAQETAPEEFLPVLEKLEETAISLAQDDSTADEELELDMPDLPDFITNNNNNVEAVDNEKDEKTKSKKKSHSNKTAEDSSKGKSSKNLEVPEFSIAKNKATTPSSKLENSDNKKDIQATTETHVRVPISIIDKLLNLAGELSITSTQVSDQLKKTLETNKLFKLQDVRVHEMLDELSNTIHLQEKSQSKAIKIQQKNKLDSLEMDSYNELHSITGLLTESILDGEAIETTLGQQLKTLNSHLRTQDNLNKELSEVILNSRMVSIKTLIPGLERTVRQTCRKTKKEVELVITGQDINIDTDIISGLTDPLLHLIRNAVDHGIEAPKERIKSAKKEQGTINLDFSRQGKFIVMKLSDDGAGIDPDKIYQRAIEKGLINPDQEFSKDEALKLILLAGFTTQDNISSISGRGVGMDVVKTSVTKLKGSINIESNLNKGTSFIIKIPLTLVTSGTLLLKTAGNYVAVPVDSIEQLTYLAADKVIHKEGEHYLQHEKEELKIQALPQLLAWHSKDIDFSTAQSIIIVKSNNKYHAVHVEEIINSRELVIKSLAPWLNNVHGIIGACHLADGGVAPVINLPQLLELKPNTDKTIENAQKMHSQTKQIPQILVVDDSLSNRKALSLIVEQLDYDVLTAVDGLDALNIINDKHIDMVFTDLEMPRMNGLELTQAIRAWGAKKELPVVMVTSRTTQKHRDLANKAGVDDYLTKPVATDDLHASMEKWLAVESLV